MAFPISIDQEERELHKLIATYNPDKLAQNQLSIGQAIYKTLVHGVLIEKLNNFFPLELHFSTKHQSLFCLPYELIADEGGDQLCQGSGSVVRVLNKKTPTELLMLPINILIIVASPTVPQLPHINIDQIQELRKEGAYYETLTAFEVIEGADTLNEIEKKISQKRYHIIQLIAHGSDNYQGNGGVVLLENEKRELDPVDGNRLWASLSRHSNHRPSLVILTSCLTGGGASPIPGQFSVVAWQLLVAGLPGVVAMQVKIETHLAIRATAKFYKKLFSGGSLDECVREMRSALSAKWYAPILAVREGVDRRVFTEEARQDLVKRNKINQEIEQRLTNYEELIKYLKTFQPQDYPLIQKREQIVKLILEHVADELEIFV